MDKKWYEKPLGKFAVAAASISVGVFVGNLMTNALSVYIPSKLGGKATA